MKIIRIFLLLSLTFFSSYCIAEVPLKTNLPFTRQFKTNGVVRGVTIDYENERIYFHAGDQYLYCLGLSGNLKWKYNTKSGAHRLQIIPFSGNILCRGSNCSSLLCLSKNGDFIWETPMGNPQQMAIDMERSQIYCVAALDKCIYCLCPNSGKILWQIPVGNSRVHALYFDEERQLFYVGSLDNFVYCVSRSGDIKWKTHIHDCEYISMDNVSGRIFCGSSNNSLSCLSLKGDIVWRYFTGGCVDGIAVDSGQEKVYCICADGYIPKPIQSAKI